MTKLTQVVSEKIDNVYVTKLRVAEEAGWAEEAIKSKNPIQVVGKRIEKNTRVCSWRRNLMCLAPPHEHPLLVALANKSSNNQLSSSIGKRRFPAINKPVLKKLSFQPKLHNM